MVRGRVPFADFCFTLPFYCFTLARGEGSCCAATDKLLRAIEINLHYFSINGRTRCCQRNWVEGFVGAKKGEKKNKNTEAKIVFSFSLGFRCCLRR